MVACLPTQRPTFRQPCVRAVRDRSPIRPNRPPAYAQLAPAAPLTIAKSRCSEHFFADWLWSNACAACQRCWPSPPPSPRGRGSKTGGMVVSVQTLWRDGCRPGSAAPALAAAPVPVPVPVPVTVTVTVPVPVPVAMPVPVPVPVLVPCALSAPPAVQPSSQHPPARQPALWLPLATRLNPHRHALGRRGF